jgi:hypothetical protein
MSQKRRNVRVRGQRRETPDMRRLARAVIELAQAAAERDAQAQDEASTTQPPEQAAS